MTTSVYANDSRGSPTISPHVPGHSGDTSSRQSVRRFQDGSLVYDLGVDAVHDFYVIAGGTSTLVPNCGGGAPPERVVNLPEEAAPKPMKPEHAVQAWTDHLGEGPYTDVHPRTGVVDPNRLVSADGRRSPTSGLFAT
ncbi:hypothetical protein [Amycolatopsis australiensis]|uniref:hypothetical protein n=1 Tax=Amycolatopsis australiensis TaxID=546364 RepID=UPI0015A6C07B|nr:hypothetical protein [Amycolatopsis australiensis]